MAENVDEKFMRRCIGLACSAEGMTYPNPLVGALIVHEGKIIGEGFHLKAGLPHAEVNAINSVKDKEKLKESTLYVNLEPCSHFGKTPPCADFIISCKIPRVVIGTTDTTAKVAGKGISRMREAGLEVVTGVLEKDCRFLNRRFFTFNEKGRPWIIFKWARSADGFMDIDRNSTDSSRPTWISGKPERVVVHKWRAAEQSVLVGAGTVRYDHPMLNVREWEGANPIAIVLSSSGNVSLQSIKGKVLVFTHNEAARIPGVELVRLRPDEPSCLQITSFLFNAGIQSLIIEGGASILKHFISFNLWDEARIFTGKFPFFNGVPSPELNGVLAEEFDFEGSRLQIYLNEEEACI